MSDSWDKTALVVGAVALIFLMAALGVRGINEPDEGRYAEVARDMVARGDWLVPHLSGVPHFTKPPFMYWCTAISLRLFGVNEWAARLPSALAAWGTVLLTMHLAGLLYGGAARWRTGVVLLSCPLFFALGRIVTTDMLLTFLATAAVVAFMHRVLRGGRAALILFYLACALGFLTKGPVAWLIIIPAIGFASFALRRAKHTPPPRLYAWIGVPLTVLLSLSWFLAVFARYPSLFDYYIHHELVDRVASNAHHRAKPSWFYAEILLGAVFPWILLVPSIVRTRLGGPLRSRSPAFWLLTGWIVIPLLVFQVSNSKLATYMLPLLPPLAIVFASGWSCVTASGVRITRWTAAFFFLMLNAFVLFGILRPSDPPAIPIITLIYGGVLALGWFAVFIWTRRPISVPQALTALGLGIALTSLALAGQADTLIRSGAASLRPIAEAIRTEYPERYNRLRIAVDELPGYGLDFYLQRTIDRRHTAKEEVPGIREPKRGQLSVFTQPGELPDVLIRREKGEHLFKLPADWVIFARAGRVVAWRPDPRQKTQLIGANRCQSFIIDVF